MAALHLCVLSAFAFAQPLFDLLGQNPEFFVAHGSGGLEIVLLALALTFVPPLVLFLVEASVRVASQRLGYAVHLLFVAALAGLIALQALKKVAPGAPPVVLLGGALVTGAACAVAVDRIRAAQALLTVLAPAPLVFLAAFLFASPVERLAFPPEPAPRASPPVRSATPVVLIVFDELPVTSLLDERRKVDAQRLPNFGRLARRSTWFRNTTSVTGETTEAVPAILTGKRPRQNRLPVFADHPDNLFTLLAGSHELEVFESITQLCPPEECKEKERGTADRAEVQLSDLGLVYLHLLLPERWTARLPSVEDAWADFRGADEPGREPDPEPGGRQRPRRLPVGARVAQVQAFVGSLGPGRPALHFLHVLLPHRPWTYLPSGRDYGNTEFRVYGQTKEGPWGTDRVLLAQAYQRYLLQLGFVDRLLGNVLGRLEATETYDESLVVVTADHGLSFRPGGGARGPVPSNVHEIAAVPLFVKLPGQRRGRVVDRAVQTIDVLPTIADALGTSVPSPVDGRSALHHNLDRRELGLPGGLRMASRELERRKYAELARTLDSVRLRPGPHGLYRIGPHAELVGRAVDRTVGPSAGIRARFDHAGRYEEVDLESGFLPAFLTGRLEGADAPVDLAVALNGRVAAVTRSFADGGVSRFAAMLSESLFRQGANVVELFAVVPGPGGARLAPVGRVN